MRVGRVRYGSAIGSRFGQVGRAAHWAGFRGLIGEVDSRRDGHQTFSVAKKGQGRGAKGANSFAELSKLAKLARASQKSTAAPRGKTKGPSAPQAPLTASATKAAATTSSQRHAKGRDAPASTPASSPSPKASSTELAGYSADDRVAFHQAFAGVESLDSPHHRKRGPDRRSLAKAVRAKAQAAEEDARARLDALVGGGVFFDILRHSDGGVEGRRRGTPDRTSRMLAGGKLPPVAHLDLHGQRTDEVDRAVRTFVRESHRAGRLDLAIIHGKGHHSEGGKGVLQGAVVRALTKGGAAPLVDAFATAPSRYGGHGAVLVRLRMRI